MQITSPLKIGLLNDLHYDGGVTALNRLYESVAILNHNKADFLVVLGDLVDGESESQARRLLREVAALCDSFHGTVHYMPGNHDLDHLSKAQFYEALGHGSEAAESHFRQNEIDFICIDGNFSPDGREYDRGNFNWEESFIPESQLAWLGGQLAAASSSVVLFSHQRIDIQSKFSVVNHAEVRNIIRLSGKVAAVFQGHQHADDMQQVAGTVCYTLSAHKDNTGPAMVHMDNEGLRLVRTCDRSNGG